MLRNPQSTWTSLPFPVICRLALVLKALRRWKSDGPSLRLMNKHWCEAIQQNIFEIRPHKSRLFIPADLISLLKFSHLTSIDISHFVASRTSAKEQNISVPSCARWYGKELKRIVHVLRQLPRLSRIEVSRGVLLMCTRHRCQDASEHWSQLRGITSLYCYCFMNPKGFGDTVLNTMWVRQHTGRGDISKALRQLIESLPCLQTVELQTCLLGPRAKLRFMKEIQKIKLHRAESIRRINDLPDQTMTVSSALLRPKIPAMFESLVDREALKSLAIRTYENPEILIQKSFVSLLRRLKVLDLSFDITFFPEMPNALFSHLCELECLNLNCCSINGVAMMGTLPHLRALRFSSVRVNDGVVVFLSQLKRLEVLNWLHVSSSNSPVLHLPLHETFLPNLWSLCVSRMKSDADIASICQRTGLEVLSIHAFGRYVTTTGLQKLNRLHHLRVFRVVLQGKSVDRLFSHFLLLEMVERLEQLWLNVRKDDLLRYQNAIDRLKRKLPRLIIATFDSVDYEPQQQFFENACFV